MFIFFYLIIVVCVFGFFIWSAVVVREQKRSWAALAAKRSLTFTRGRFMAAAQVRGAIDGIGFALFSDVQRTQDVRGERHVSVLEFDLGPGMATGAALGTPEMRAFIDGLSFTETYLPPQSRWSGDYVVRTRDVAALRDYLTDARIEALVDVFGMNRVAALFFFDEKDAILHLETVDPLRDPTKLDRIINRLLADAKKLQLDGMAVARPASDLPLPVATPATATEPLVVEESSTLPPPAAPTL